MGTGNDSSKYTYYVETLSDGNREYLTRQAFLNKGFDFVIRVENADYGHKGSYKFECQDIKEIEYSELHFESGLSPEHILKVIKWLFIEQDIAYWNYSGRNMTWGLVPDKN